jgi:hypothetical protein
MFSTSSEYVWSSRWLRYGYYSDAMAEAKRQTATVGWVGVLCLAIYWTARFAPDVADTLALSSFGKFVVFGSLPAGVLLTTIAAIRGSKWWLVVVAAGAITLADLFIHISRMPPLY